MFKPGDRVIDRVCLVLPETNKGGSYEVISASDWLKRGHSADQRGRFLSEMKSPICTSGGLIFEEDELIHAHPTVLATAECRDLWGERFREESRDRMDLNELSREARRKLEKALRGASIEFNGHWKDGTILYDRFRRLDDTLLLYGRSPNKEDAEAVVQALESGGPLDRWVPIDLGMTLSGLRRCSYCGEDDFVMETNGKSVRIAGEPCKWPNGLPLTEWELNVPSGKIVVANDLRELFPTPDDEDFDINTTLGCRQTALAYADSGMSHAFVGNSCPGVYRCQDGSFKIANEPRDGYWDSKSEKYLEVTPDPFDGDRLASICTDLWWYSIVDHDEYKRRLKRFKQKSANFAVKIVTVKPGVYRFRHDEEARSYQGPGETVYTRFEWVREPDPVKDFLGLYEAADVNPHAYVHRSVASYPTLYGKVVDTSAWARVADHLFCTIGNGVDWHEKGFPKTKVDPSIPDVEPPAFREQHNWYPLSDNYSSLVKRDKLTPSFAKLAFRVMESIISFGMVVRDHEGRRDVKDVRARMSLVAKRYIALAAKYPDSADPEYVEWLSQGKRVKAWIENFPLGPDIDEKKIEDRKNLKSRIQSLLPKGVVSNTGGEVQGLLGATELAAEKSVAKSKKKVASKKRK